MRQTCPSHVRLLFFMRDHILEVAANLFYHDGIRSTGIDTVIARAGIAKATLYRHFPGKEDLIVAYLRSRHERVMQGFEEVLNQRLGSAEARVDAIFELLEEKGNSETFRGCAFLMAVSEFADAPRIVKVAQEHKLAVRDIFRRALATEVSDSEAVAEQLGLVYDGALAAIMIQKRAHPAVVGRAIARSLLGSHLENGTTSHGETS